MAENGVPPAGGNQEQLRLPIDLQEIQKLLDFVSRLEKGFTELLVTEGKFNTELGNGMRNVQMRMQAFEKMLTLQGKLNSPLGNLAQAELRTKGDLGANSSLDSLLKQARARERLDELQKRTDADQLKSLASIKEMQNALNKEKEKEVLLAATGRDADASHAKAIQAQLQAQIKTEQELISLRRIAQEQRARESTNLPGALRQQYLKQELTERMFASGRPLDIQRMKGDQAFNKLMETGMVMEQVKALAMQKQTIDGIRQINNLEDIELEKQAAILRLQAARNAGLKEQAIHEQNILKAIREQKAELNKQAPIPTLRTTGQVNQAIVRNEARERFYGSDFMLSLQRTLLEQRGNKMLERDQMQMEASLLASRKQSIDAITKIDSLEQLTLEKMAAQLRLQEARRAGNMAQRDQERAILTLLEQQERVIKDSMKPAKPVVPLTQFEKLSLASKQRYEQLALANSGGFLDLRQDALQKQLGRQARDQYLAEASGSRVALEGVKALTQGNEILLQVELTRFNLKRAFEAKNTEQILKEMQLLEALTARRRELNTIERQRARNTGLSHDERIAQQRTDIRTRVLGDGGANMMTVQAGLMLNYRLLGGVQSMFSGAAQAAKELDSALRQLQAIAAVSNNQMVQLKETLVEVAKGSRFTSAEVAKAAVLLAQSGYSAGQIEGAMKAVILLAQATGSELSKAVDVVTSVLTVFNKSSDEAGRVANQLTEALNRSKLDIEKLALGIQYAGNSSEDAGVKFEELVASLGAMANAGIRSGSTLGTGFSQILTALQKPSEKFITTLGRVGLTLDDVNIKTQGYRGVLKNLAEAGFTANDAIQSFEVRGARAFTALTNNIDTMDEMVHSLEDTSAAFAANEIQMGSFANQADRLKSNLGVLASEALAPTLALLRDGASTAADAAGDVSTFTKSVQILGTAVSVIISGAALNLLIKLVRGFGAIVAVGPALASGSGMIAAGWAAMSARGLATVTTLGGITTALRGTQLAMIGVGQSMAALIGGWPGLILAAGAAIAIFANWRQESERLNDAFDKQKAKFDAAAEATDKVKQSVEKVDDAVGELINQYGRLNGNQSETIKAAEDMQARFKSLGLNLGDFSNITIDGLINKLKELRAEVQADYVVKLRAEGESELDKMSAEVAKNASQIKDAAKDLSKAVNAPELRKPVVFNGKILSGTAPSYPQGFGNYQASFDNLVKYAMEGNTSKLKEYGFPDILAAKTTSVQLGTALSNTRARTPEEEEVKRQLTKVLELTDKVITLQDVQDYKLKSLAEAPKAMRIRNAAALRINIDQQNPLSPMNVADSVQAQFGVMKTEESRLKHEATVDAYKQARQVRKDFVGTNMPVLDKLRDDIRTAMEALRGSTREQDKIEILVLNEQLRRVNLVRDSLSKEQELLKEEEKKQNKQDLEALVRERQQKVAMALNLLNDKSKNWTSAQLDEHYKAVLAAMKLALDAEIDLKSLDTNIKAGVTNEAELNAIRQQYKQREGDLLRQYHGNKEQLQKDVQQRLSQLSSDEFQQETTDTIQRLRESKTWIERRYAEDKGLAEGRVGTLQSQLKQIDLDQANTYASKTKVDSLRQDAARLGAQPISKNPDVAEIQRNAISKNQFLIQEEMNKLKTHNTYQGLASEFQRRSIGRKLLEAQDAAAASLADAAEKMIQQYKKIIDDTIEPAMVETKKKMVEVAADLKKLEGKMRDSKGNVVTLSPEEERQYNQLRSYQSDLKERYDQLFSQKQDYNQAITGKTDDVVKYREKAAEVARSREPIMQSIFDGLGAAQQQATSSFSDMMTKLETRALKGTKNIREFFRSMGAGILESMLQVINNAIAKQFMNMLVNLGMSAFGGGTGELNLGVSAAAGELNLGVSAAAGEVNLGVGRYSGGPIHKYSNAGIMQTFPTVKHFFSGGSTGGGTDIGRDNIPAMLRPGEFVLQPSATKALGEDFLMNLNTVSEMNLKQNAPKPVAHGGSTVINQRPMNVYVVSPDQKPVPSRDDIIVAVSEDLQRGGPIKQLVKAVN